MDSLQIISLAINCLLGLVAFFGGMTIKGLSEAIRELRHEDGKLRDKMDGFVKIDMLEIWRKEQREDTKLIFDKLEQIRRDLVAKVDRSECSRCAAP
jgi:hypothetical protein